MTEVKLADAMARAIRESDDANTSSCLLAECVLAHPEFRAQVAELMRGMVPGRDSDGGSYALAHNHCREDVFARIQQWEEGA